MTDSLSRYIEIVWDLYSVTQAELLQGVRDYIREHQKLWVLQSVFPQYVTVSRCAGVCDGVILTVGVNQFSSYTDLPAVAVRCEQDDSLCVPAEIKISNRQIMDTAVDYFHARGFGSIAFAGYPHDSVFRWIERRETAFRESCARRGVDAVVFPVSSTSSDQNDDLICWLKRLEHPAAVIAINDRRAMDVYRACQTSGLRIPQDVAVTGVDNFPAVCQFVNPKLTSISLNYYQIGRKAAYLLDRQFQGENGRESLVVPVSLIERGSTDISIPQDERVEQVLCYIRNHIHEPIQACDICDAVGVSQAVLHRYLKQWTGYGIAEILQKERLRKARQLLLNKTFCLKDVAFQCGFRSTQYFSNVFRKHTGLTPGNYRHISCSLDN